MDTTSLENRAALVLEAIKASAGDNWLTRTQIARQILGIKVLNTNDIYVLDFLNLQKCVEVRKVPIRKGFKYQLQYRVKA
jgi:hypothetical protein